MNPKKDTWSGEHYKKHKGFQSHTWAIEKINFNGNETILDIGCGDGNITAEIANEITTGSVLGIDSSQSMIDTAKQTYKDIHNLSFSKADATNFTTTKKFDLITSFFVLHWIANPLVVLKRIKKHLKPHGKTIIIMQATQKEAPISKALENLEQEGKWKDAIQNCKKNIHTKTAKQIEDLLNQAGFENKHIKIIQRKSESSSLETTVQSLMRSIPHSSKLPEEKALRFSQDIAKKYINSSIKNQMKAYFLSPNFY